MRAFELFVSNFRCFFLCFYSNDIALSINPVVDFYFNICVSSSTRADRKQNRGLAPNTSE